MTHAQFLLGLLVTVSGVAHALEYKTLNEPAIVYDAGSRQAVPLFILRKGTPVEVIVNLDRWVKIREQTGGLGWVEKMQLGDARQVIVTSESVTVRQQADENAPAAFTVSKDVLLEPVEQPGGAWLKVRHRDGQTGFVPIKAVWGL